MSGGKIAWLALASAAAGALVYHWTTEPSGCCAVVAQGIEDKAVSAAGGGALAQWFGEAARKLGVWRGLVPLATLVKG